MNNPPTPAITEGQLIRTALGEAWCNLSPKTQKRFENDPERQEYIGLMSEVSCTRLGKMMAAFAKLFGSPLIPHSGRDVPIEVLVYKKPGNSDIFKKRTYFFKNTPPFTVQTHMHVNERGEFMEYAGLGLGLKMAVRAKDGKLYFHGLGYGLSVGKYLLPIPAFLSPGIAFIEHSDYGEKQFRVRIEMRHPWFGVMFIQDGVFGEKNG